MLIKLLHCDKTGSAKTQTVGNATFNIYLQLQNINGRCHTHFGYDECNTVIEERRLHLVLTNDGTASRTLAFAGGTFMAQGESVTRTTAD